MTARVVVVGLGPGDPGLVSTGALDAISSAERRYLRTSRHPSAHLAEPARSFDHLYETAPSFEEVYAGVVDALAEAANESGEVLYAVPGSPYVLERTVELLRSDPRVEVKVVPSLSFLDLAWERLGVDPVAGGVRLVDGQSFAEAAAGQPGPFLIGHTHSKLVLSEVKLAIDAAIGGDAGDGLDVTVLQRLGLPDEKIFDVPWADLDREVEPDHLTCVWVPRLAAPVASDLTRFVELVRTLRSECPWDRAQTHQSLVRHLLEETYEVVDAIAGLETQAPPGPDGADGYGHLQEELGDLLFQVAFHATLAAEAGEFDLSDVARGIHDKLVRRHPHVFCEPGTPAPNWEEQKKAEKSRASVMDGVPAALPSLLYAHKVQSKAASIGFDWEDASGAWSKIDEELAELRAALEAEPARGPGVADELGDVLFSVVNVARHIGIEPEGALRASALKFRRRFAAMEALSESRGVPIDDALWDEVKAAGAAQTTSVPPSHEPDQLPLTTQVTGATRAP